MAHESTTNLLFLLGMMSLGAGCSAGDGDDNATLGPAMTSAPGVGTDGSATDDADDDGDDGDGVATTGPVPGDSGPAATSGGDGSPPADAGDDSGTSGGYATYGGYGTYGGTYGMADCSMPAPAGPIGPQCQSYQAKLDECLGAEITPECIAYYTAFCQYDMDYGTMAGGACGTAIEDYWACLSALSCQEFDSKAACQAQLTTLDTACGKAAPPHEPSRRTARSG